MKTWTKNEIKDLLVRSDKAVLRGILAIYARQTIDEQLSDDTVEHNGVGFSGCDAFILSQFAKQIQDWEIDNRGYKFPLSPKQFAIARKKIVKYAGQLTEIANVV